MSILRPNDSDISVPNQSPYKGPSVSLRVAGAILTITAAATSAVICENRTTKPRVENSDAGQQNGIFDIMGNLKKGTWTRPDGIIESGTFEDGQIARGNRSFKDGREEAGHFVNGCLQSGQIISGTKAQQSIIFIENGKPTGVEERTYVDAKGRIVKERGPYVNGQLHGEASRSTSSESGYHGGFTEAGKFAGGKLNGKGSITYESVEIVGDFADGKLDGQGEIIRTSGEIIESGTYKAGLLHGKGQRNNSNVSEEGEFTNGKLRSGKKIIFGDGANTVMEGTFDEKGNLITGSLREGHNSYGILYSIYDVEGGIRTLKRKIPTGNTDEE